MNVDIYSLAILVLIGIGIIVGSFTILGAIAFWKSNSKGIGTFAELFERGGPLKIITVGWIVIAVTFLALAGVMSESAVVAILNGTAGYVLGGVGNTKEENFQLMGNVEELKGKKLIEKRPKEIDE